MKKTTMKKPAAVAQPDPKPETPQPGQVQLNAGDNCFVRAQKILMLLGLGGLIRFGVDKFLAEYLQAYMDADGRQYGLMLEQAKKVDG